MEVALRNHRRQLTDVDLDDDDSFAFYPRLPPLNTNVNQRTTIYHEVIVPGMTSDSIEAIDLIEKLVLDDLLDDLIEGDLVVYLESEL